MSTARRKERISQWFQDVYRYDCDARIALGSPLCGVDEAGRGPLAGPVVAAAVILPDDWVDGPVFDSKQLTRAEREYAYAQVTTCAIAYGIGIVDRAYIDQYNILQATYEAMRLALRDVLHAHPQMVLVDGATIPGILLPQRKVIKGDATSQSIAAASVLAKVTRDRLMCEADSAYPGYGFAEHAGYGTPRHLDALRMYGPCDIHRRTFAPVQAAMQAMMGVQEVSAASVCDRRESGMVAESLAVDYLLSLGYELVQRNWRCALGEIDAVLLDGDTLVFLEVRSRHAADEMSGLSLAEVSVGSLKQKRLRKLAEAYCTSNRVSHVSVIRFDVVAVAFLHERTAFEHIVDAIV